MSLSTWFRDYLYIPLGGNRVKLSRKCANLMIVFLISGLWHGANWTFVAWGGLHGLYLWIEKAITDRRTKKLSFLADVKSSPVNPTAPIAQSLLSVNPNFGLPKALLTYLLICITWVFFRSGTFQGAWLLLLGMTGQIHTAQPLLATISIIKVGVIIVAMLAFHWLMRNTTVLQVVSKLPWFTVGIVWSLMLILLLLSQESGKSFIYFQF